jgi:hypothetical protein
MTSHRNDTQVPAARLSTDTLKQYENQVENVEADFDQEEALKKGDVDAQKVDHFGTGTTYSAEEKALVRRLDWHILPIIWCMYYMVFPFYCNPIIKADAVEQDRPKRNRQCPTRRS